MLHNMLVATIIGLAFIISPLANTAEALELPLNTKSNIESAEAAIKAGDKDAFDSALNNLREQQESLESQSKGKPNQFVSEENIKQAGEYADNVSQTIKDLKNQWKTSQQAAAPAKKTALWTDYYSDDYVRPTAPYYDPELTGSDAWFDAIDLSFEIIAGIFNPSNPEGYTGSEVTATPSTRTLGDISVDKRGSILGFNSELRIPLGEVPNVVPNVMPNLFPNLYANNRKPNYWDIILGVDIERAEVNEAQSTHVTGGRDLLLVGVGAGPNPSGFVVPAVNSTVTDITYDAEYDYNRYRFGVGKTLDMPNSEDDIQIRPFGGIEYGDFESWQTFTGVTNAGTLPFSYTTGVNNDFIAPFVGVELSARPQILSSALQIPVELNSSFSFAYTFNNARGTDTLNVTGFTPGTANISNDDHTHDITAEIGVTLFPDAPFNVTLGGQYENVGNIPDVTRIGSAPSELSFDDAHTFVGTLRTTFTF